jgi:antitoxin ParD1/3/4
MLAGAYSNQEATRMNVSLSLELERFVNQKIESGMYTSASEVVREALRLLHERDQLSAAQLAVARGKIAEGLSQLKRGEVVGGRRLREELREKRT